MTILTQTPGASILDNYADVIEGGSDYSDGDARNGIPGVLGLHVSAGGDFADALLIADATVSTTVLEANDLSDAAAAALDRTDGPPWFLRCSSGTAANVGAARRIDSYAAATNRYTVAPGFPDTITTGDRFLLMEGFKRAPDGVDINADDGTAGGFDRVFDLRFVPGRQLDWEGSGNKWFEAILEIRLRLLRHKRARRLAQLVVDTLTMWRSVISRPDQRDGTYVQKCDVRDAEPEIEVDDTTKVVVLDRYDLIYKVDATFL